jgi:hypothetical protein
MPLKFNLSVTLKIHKKNRERERDEAKNDKRIYL